jgi:Holliday junction resolvase RusA-like endonuclease
MLEGRSGEVEFELEMPPSVNHLYVQRRGGKGRALTKEAEAYQSYIKQVVGDNLHLLGGFPLDQEQVYGISITAQFTSLQNPGWFEVNMKGPNKGQRKAKSRYRRIDVDNRIKFVQDCLTKTIGIPDDSQVFADHARKIEGPDEKLTIRIFVEDPADYLRGQDGTEPKL